MTLEHSADSSEKRTESVLGMTLVRMVEIAYNTQNQTTLERLRVELLRRKANVPENMDIPSIDQAYVIVDAKYIELLESLR